jgi:hypothetical protein
MKILCSIRMLFWLLLWALAIGMVLGFGVARQSVTTPMIGDLVHRHVEVGEQHASQLDIRYQGWGLGRFYQS